MKPYRVAHLSAEQMSRIEGLENEIGVTLVAYQPEASAGRENMVGGIQEHGGQDPVPDAQSAVAQSESDLVLDALVDTYRTYDPPGR